jgi:hypothetical protein
MIFSGMQGIVGKEEENLQNFLLASDNITWINHLNISSFNNKEHTSRMMYILEEKRYIPVSIKTVTMTRSTLSEETMRDFLVENCPRAEAFIWRWALSNRKDFVDVEFLCGFSCLTRLNLNDCQVDDSSLIYLAKLKNSLKRLSATHNQITDDGLQIICDSLPHLESLDITACNQITNKGISHLPKLVSLKELNLACIVDMTDEWLEDLSSMITVEFLELRGCWRLTDNAFRHLVGLTNLEELNIEGCYGITVACFEHFLQLPNLRADKIAFSHTNITGEQIEEFKAKKSVFD